MHEYAVFDREGQFFGCHDSLASACDTAERAALGREKAKQEPPEKAILARAKGIEIAQIGTIFVFCYYK